jgi:hypothetical protein
MLRVGIALSGVGLGLVAAWGGTSPVALLVASLLLIGAGQGLLQVGYTDIVTATLPRADRGVAGSLAMMTRTLGVVSAAALLTLWFEQWRAAAEVAGATPNAAFLHGFSAAFALAAALCAGVLLLLIWPASRLSATR